MPGVRLLLALHNHQPVGNFDGVFESSYQASYKPFLDVLEGYPDISFALHTSGPLLEWLAEGHPEYLARVKALVEAGRVEILGGGFFEPILPMIPHRDRVAQIRRYSEHLHETFGQPVRGIWLPERVWEQHLVGAIAEAGIEYTLLDDFHFDRTGVEDADLTGYFLTEDEGRLLKVFPVSERLRYLIPFEEPHACYEYLRRVAEQSPGATVAFADDGEKFGAWPGTFDHVYNQGWLGRFCDMLSANRDWIQTITPSRAVDTSLPLGKVYLPDSSYREMTEWVLPADRQREYHKAVGDTTALSAVDPLRPFIRAGGFWRNFLAKYAESHEMYARMLAVSDRLDAAGPDDDPDYLEAARQELHRGQCNCPYWHGAFGGLYLPHLRNAIYRHLIAADIAIDDAQGRTGPRATAEVGDFNLDARQEIRLENDRLAAFVRPATGGHIYELDVKHALTNVLATLDRRPEPYHKAVAAAARGDVGAANHGPAIIADKVVLKDAGLDRLLIYDRTPRKALVDHVLTPDATLDDLIAGRDVERGDFVSGAYLSKVRREAGRATLVMERPGFADGQMIHVRKTITVEADRPNLEVVYELEDLPTDRPVHFAVEINLAAMAGHADDRYFLDTGGRKLGPLDTPLDHAETTGLGVRDEWLELAIDLGWSRPAGLWALPIATVSQSEGGYESVFQSTAILPHWIITAGEDRRWEVRILWSLDRHRATPAGAAASPRAAGRGILVGS